MVYMPLDTLTTDNWHCAGSARYDVKVRKKLTGWKQGHTPAELSEPLPLAGVLFWEAFLSETRVGSRYCGSSRPICDVRFDKSLCGYRRFPLSLRVRIQHQVQLGDLESLPKSF